MSVGFGVTPPLQQFLEDPVSLQPLVKPQLLPCGHTFSKETIDGLEDRRCPLDRIPFEQNATAPDYVFRGLLTGSSEDEKLDPNSSEFREKLEAVLDLFEKKSDPKEAFQQYLKDLRALREDFARERHTLSKPFQNLGDRLIEQLDEYDQKLRESSFAGKVVKTLKTLFPYPLFSLGLAGLGLGFKNFTFAALYPPYFFALREVLDTWQKERLEKSVSKAIRDNRYLILTTLFFTAMLSCQSIQEMSS